MVPSNLSSFICYELDPTEEAHAYTYTHLQIAGIQNQIAAAAEEMLRTPLDLDETSIEAIKKRSYLKGQIVALKHLLALHDSTTQTSQTD